MANGHPQALIRGADRTGKGSAADDLWIGVGRERPRSPTDHYPNSVALAFSNGDQCAEKVCCVNIQHIVILTHRAITAASVAQSQAPHLCVTQSPPGLNEVTHFYMHCSISIQPACRQRRQYAVGKMWCRVKLAFNTVLGLVSFHIWLVL